jgi:hypothetical protein
MARNMITIRKARRIHAARTEEIGNDFGISVIRIGILDHLEDVGVDGSIILKLILKNKGMLRGFVWFKVGTCGGLLSALY